MSRETTDGQRFEGPAPAVAPDVLALVDQALGRRRGDLTEAIDGEVLQYACVALQDLQEIHRASPTESLWRAIGNLHNAITALRGLVEQQPGRDEQLVRGLAERGSDPDPTVA